MEQINIRAVEMVRNIRDTHYEQLKDKARAERILFYREKAGRLYARLLQQQHIRNNRCNHETNHISFSADNHADCR